VPHERRADEPRPPGPDYAPGLSFIEK
jgi:hypothetical protein